MVCGEHGLPLCELMSSSSPRTFLVRGSPVYIIGQNGTVTTVGVVWATNGGATGVFSNLGQMKQDLGNLRFF